MPYLWKLAIFSQNNKKKPLTDLVSGVQARRPPSLCQRAPPPFLLDSSLHSTHLYTYSSLHSTHLCATTHHSQLFPMCGLFMHLSPIPLAAEITFTSTHMCMFVFHCVYYLTDYIRFRALGTPALRCRLGCPVLDYCFVFACLLLI